MASGTALAERIEADVEAPLAELGLDVEAVEVSSVGKRRVLRIAVDKDGGVTLDDVADATRTINGVLDSGDTMGESPYTLEVTSRGVDRPLTLPRHWRRNIGRLVKVHRYEDATVTGRITAAADDPDGGATLEVSGRQVAVPYARVSKALVQIEFNRPAASEGSDEHPDEDEPTEGDD